MVSPNNLEADQIRSILISCTFLWYNQMPKKTIYGRCPRCKTKSELEVKSGEPGREKFRCNQCYGTFGMDDL